jgi:hypothetical protein
VQRDVQKWIAPQVVYFILQTTLDAQHHEVQLRRIDAGIVEAIRSRQRRAAAVNAMSLDSRETFLLDRDDDLVAVQQTDGAVCEALIPRIHGCSSAEDTDVLG